MREQILVHYVQEGYLAIALEARNALVVQLDSFNQILGPLNAWPAQLAASPQWKALRFALLALLEKLRPQQEWVLASCAMQENTFPQVEV